MDKKRKILICTMGLDIGGAETHIVELSRELCRRGYAVAVASNGGAYVPELEKAGVRHISVPLNRRRPLPMLVSLFRLRKIIRRERPDVVHAHARIPGFLCGILRRTMKFPFVTTAHWVFDTGGALGSLTNWGQKVIAVSDDIKAYLIENYGVPPEDITVTINGIDTEKFSPDISGADIKSEFSIPEDAPVISYVSRMDGSRALAARHLIAAAPELAEKIPALRIIIAGGGDVYDELLAQAEKVNEAVGYDCIFMPGARTDINKIAAAGDIFIGVSRAALEAMSAGKPVIVAGNEGCHGIFTPEKLTEAMLGNFCCRGLPQCTPEKLRDDVLELFSLSPEKRREMGQYNRQVIFSHYSVSRMADDAEKVYESVWRPKTAVISGYYGYNNLGDDAILLSIRKRFDSVCPSARLIALSNDPASTEKQYGVPAVPRFNLFKVSKAVKSADLFISGGGSLLQDSTSTRSLLYYLSVIKIALRQKKPVMLYANGIGPVTKKNNRKKVAKALDRAESITLRDSGSLQELRDMGVKNGNISITSDPVFTIDGVPRQEAEKLLRDAGVPTDKPIAAVSMRSSPGMETAISRLAAFCDMLGKSHTVLFLIMQTPGDGIITEKIRGKMSGKSYVFQSPGAPESMMGVVGLCDTVFSMRLHTIIFSAKMRVPVMGLIYDPKVAAYLKMVDMPGCGTPEDFSPEKAMEVFRDIQSRRGEFAARLDNAAKELEQAALKNDRELCGLLGL